MEKVDTSSFAGCIMMCYRAASPLTCIALVISSIILSLIISLQDFYKSFTYIFHSISNLLSNACKCCNTQVKKAPPKESTSKTCTTQNAQNAQNESILREDLEIVMQRLGMFLDPSDGKVQEDIGSREISTLFDENEPSLEEVKEAFDMFDENGDGYIDAKELRKIVCNLGFSEASEDECRRMIKTFDVDRDGRINLCEFVKVVKESFSS